MAWAGMMRAFGAREASTQPEPPSPNRPARTTQPEPPSDKVPSPGTRDGLGEVCIDAQRVESPVHA